MNQDRIDPGQIQKGAKQKMNVAYGMLYIGCPAPAFNRFQSSIF